MLRSDALHGIQSYLETVYSGPITLLRQEDDGDLTPPYALVRIGSAENIGMGQVDLWDLSVLVAVFHDAEMTAPTTAEAQAAELFAALEDPEPLIAAIAPEVVASWWERLSVEAAIADTRWSHVAGFRLIAAPQDV